MKISGDAFSRKQRYATSSGIPLKENYGPEDMSGNPEAPGEFPYSRGIYSGMYRDRLWTMRQYSGLTSVEKTRERMLELQRQGETGLSVAFDLPTQMGFDSDSPLVRDEVGLGGVPIDCLRDFERMFEGVDLEKISVSMTINATAPVLMSCLIALADKRGASLDRLRGTIQNDILKEYMARGTYVFPIEPSLRMTLDLVEYCEKTLPKFNAMSVSGYHFREAGASAVQELAFAFANAARYLECIRERGLDMERICRRLSFFFSVQMDFFEEVAKLRAARKVWAHLVKERFGIDDPAAAKLRFHIHTGGISLQARQYELNTIRVTLQALAAVLGGTQSLHTSSFDEAFATPSERAAVTALRTQQIIAFETGVANVADPLGGSYFVESLTGEIEERTLEEISRIDDLGGSDQAIESGYFQEEMAKNAFMTHKRVEEKTDVVVGVNRFVEEESPSPQLDKMDVESRNRQIEELEKFKKNRNMSVVGESLNRLKESAEGNDNLIPVLTDCLRRDATLGEICGVLRSAFGEWREPGISGYQSWGNGNE